MAASTHIENVAIIGATGNLGSLILQSVLSANRFTVTAITRSIATSTLPKDNSLTVLEGDYDNPAFLLSALTGQDALVLVLGGTALIQPQTTIIEAAVEAGVKLILPTEYGTDSAHDGITKAVPLNSLKVPARLRLDELARKHEGLNWIGVITGLWFDYSLKAGFFKIDVPARNATLLDGGKGKFNTTTKRTIANAVARLLSLPYTSTSEKTSLTDFKNGFVYVSSFLTSQREILDAVERVTVTEDKDWDIENVDAQRYIEEGRERLAKGDFGGMVNVLGGMIFKGGMGGDYESVKGVSNQVLGLPQEDLDNAVKDALGQSASKS